jgi:2'-5' RNA ligase
MAAGGGVRQALSASTHRVFFALWPGAGVRAGLARAAREMHRTLGGRCTRADSIHLPRLLAPPAGVFTSAFRVTLDQWGCWARNGIGWTAPSQVPVSLRDLAENLEGWLRGAGFGLEQRAFAPHVTLVRKAQCAPMPDVMAPIAWQVDELALIHSHLMPGGSRYRKLGVWPLK